MVLLLLSLMVLLLFLYCFEMDDVILGVAR